MDNAKREESDAVKRRNCVKKFWEPYNEIIIAEYETAPSIEALALKLGVPVGALYWHATRRLNLTRGRRRTVKKRPYEFVRTGEELKRHPLPVEHLWVNGEEEEIVHYYRHGLKDECPLGSDLYDVVYYENRRDNDGMYICTVKTKSIDFSTSTYKDIEEYWRWVEDRALSLVVDLQFSGFAIIDSKGKRVVERPLKRLDNGDIVSHYFQSIEEMRSQQNIVSEWRMRLISPKSRKRKVSIYEPK